MVPTINTRGQLALHTFGSMTFRDFIPPVITRIRAALRDRPAVPEPTAPSFDAALRMCGSGYSDDQLAQVILTKSVAAAGQDVAAIVGPLQTATTLLAVMTAAAQSRSRPLRVLDFGGAFGLSHFLARQRTRMPLLWAVVETPAFVKRSAGLETGELRFFDSVAAAQAWLGNVDLAYTSGALQYTPSPEDALSSLLDLQPGVLALLRCAFSRDDRLIEIQSSLLSENGPGPLPSNVQDRLLRYPRTFATESGMLEACGRSHRLLANVPSPASERPVTIGRRLICDGVYIWVHKQRDLDDPGAVDPRGPTVPPQVRS